MIAKPIILSVKPFPKKKLLISYCSLLSMKFSKLMKLLELILFPSFINILSA